MRMEDQGNKRRVTANKNQTSDKQLCELALGDPVENWAATIKRIDRLASSDSFLNYVEATSSTEEYEWFKKHIHIKEVARAGNIRQLR